MINFNLTKENIESEDLKAFELEFDFTLSTEYKKHMLKFKGGTPEKDYFKGVNIAFFNPIKYGKTNLDDVIKALENILPDGYLPFAYDPGDNQICIYLNKGVDYGKVYYVPMDMGDIEPEFLVESFEEFLNGLTSENNY